MATNHRDATVILVSFLIGGIMWMPLGLALGALIRVSRVSRVSHASELADISEALKKDRR